MLGEVADSYDIAVIGGGINGAAIARQAAAMRYSTLLVEKNDWAHATSSQSSKLIHGGIRYLEQARFGLVRESLDERRVLLHTARHLVKPISINIPVYKGDRRAPWKIALGCRLYDIFAGKYNLRRSRRMTAEEVDPIEGLKKDGLKGVIQYRDGQTDDARLVLEMALSAQAYGATVRNYTELKAVDGSGGDYALELFDKRSGQTLRTTAKWIINAAGPWVPALDEAITGANNRPKLRYVRGIHFVVDSIGQKDGFLCLPRDGRVVFVLPWLDKYTLIGTTESVFEGTDFDRIPVSQEEKDYLLRVYNDYFPDKAIRLEDVKHIYSGVRTLIDMGEDELKQMSREYRLEEEAHGATGGYLAVFGGKLTTARSLAAKVMERVSWRLPERVPPQLQYDTARENLPGGFITHPATANFWRGKLLKAGWDAAVVRAWARRYGSRWIDVARIALAMEPVDARQEACPGLTHAELRYLRVAEQAHADEDVLFRRTKLGYEYPDAVLPAE